MLSTSTNASRTQALKDACAPDERLRRAIAKAYARAYELGGAEQEDNKEALAGGGNQSQELSDVEAIHERKSKTS